MQKELFMSKTRCHGTMTESAYLAWIRSALRSKSLRWLPRSKAIEAARRPYKGSNKLQKWEVQCALCTNWFKLKEICVDHYPVEAGSILSIDDVGQFCNNLFCEIDNLRCLCKECHDVHTFATKNSITFEEAELEKYVINLLKSETKSDIILFIESWQGVFNNEEYLTGNEAQRRKALVEIFRNVCHQ